MELMQQEEDVKRHKIFSLFLDSVVSDTSPANQGFADIADLQDRFRSLKTQNNNLQDKKGQFES
jgi:hypothetical protein